MRCHTIALVVIAALCTACADRKISRLESQMKGPLQINAAVQHIEVSYKRDEVIDSVVTLPVFSKPEISLVASPVLNPSRKQIVVSAIKRNCISRYPKASVMVEVLELRQEFGATWVAEKQSALASLEVVFSMEDGRVVRKPGYAEISVTGFDVNEAGMERLLNLALNNALYQSLEQVKAELNDWR